jgi:DNA-binding MarR family transcriptional regulator
MRAVDIHSRSLIGTHGLTGPQAIILKELERSGVLTVGEIASRVTLSKATVTDILNRLERRELVRRSRSEGDRRKILIDATTKALDILRHSPPLLQERFVSRFKSLRPWEQTQLLSSIQRVAEMMDAENLDAAPLLASAPVAIEERELSSLLQASNTSSDETTDTAE